MASNLRAYTCATPRASTSTHSHKPLISPLPQQSTLLLSSTTNKKTITITTRITIRRSSRIRVVSSREDGDHTYLDMWKNAMDRERKVVQFQNIAEKSPPESIDNGIDNDMDVEKKSQEFKKILDVSKEERDRVQRMQVIDRAAAAIAAARSFLQERLSTAAAAASGGDDEDLKTGSPGGTQNGSLFLSGSETSENGVPGPDFWSWTPPDSDSKSDNVSDPLAARKSLVYPTSAKPVAMKERTMDFLSIPFESKLSQTNHNPPIPPLQSLVEVEKAELSESSLEMPSVKAEEHELGVLFSGHAAEAAHALDKDKVDESSSFGINPDGSKWWKETGIDQRPDGVICRWTMARGVSADQDVEWQEKFWEAADDFGYKELGSEKSGRDATGNVWREYWRESMVQDSGLVHLEKTADKWGKTGKGDEWQEKWWEHHDASGKAEKWAHKWCSIDPATQLDAGHAHVWHERWGENYDGHGGSMKYTDKWAERCEADGWTKWGDKWDENFDPNGHGVKQGETWWEGKHGERWNRTWGEGHNGSGWVHKYGKSSSGEHWDTYVEQETWYERFPHYGFYHCFDNSVQLREVCVPSELDEP